MDSLISKARKPKFDLFLKVFDLNNVPLVSGTSYIKWHLPSSTSAEHRGRTDKSPIKEHNVSWDYVKTIPVRLTIDKSNSLQDCMIHFEIIQDYNAGGRGEKITLGQVTLNLAEYVEESEIGSSGDGEEAGVVRRYLMQESKINSTLKVGICMKQTDGERNFVAPPLKMAPVFGGIAGIMAGEQVENEDVGRMASFLLRKAVVESNVTGIDVPTVSKPRDNGESQDMYRRTLAASWASHKGELPADECVEDIFNGGDGWKGENLNFAMEHASGAEDDEVRLQSHQRSSSGASSTHSQETIRGRKRGAHEHEESKETLATGLNGSGTSSESLHTRGRRGWKKAQEVDEFKVRDDLMAWRLPGSVKS